MTNRIRQYPRVKQRADRPSVPSLANSLLHILSAIRELYNSSNDGRSASSIRDLGYDQLVAFLHIDMRMNEEEIEQNLRPPEKPPPWLQPPQRHLRLRQMEHLACLGLGWY
jgi:hypothetical protein